MSFHVDEAKEKLEAMKRPVPAADPAALARMKYEEEHRTKVTMMQHATGPIKSMISHGPDTRLAAKSGTPSMETMRPPTPISVPTLAGGTPGTSGGEVTVSPTGTSDIDSKPDARAPGATAPPGTPVTAAPAAETPAAGNGNSVTASPATTAPAATAGQAPLPTNYQTQTPKQKKAKKKKQPKNAVTTTAPPAAAPAPADAAAPAQAPVPKTNPEK